MASNQPFKLATRRRNPAKVEENNEGRERLTCFVRILPPGINSWTQLVQQKLIKYFPLTFLPVQLDSEGYIVLDDDNEVVLLERDDTIQLVEFRTNSQGKSTVSFTVPILYEEDPYYSYITRTLTEPLQTMTDGKPTIVRADSDNKRDGYILISQIVQKNDVKQKSSRFETPDQSRFA